MYDLQDGFYYDLLLLDIEMPEVSGMDLAKTIQEKMSSARIIFITSHLEYSIEAYTLLESIISVMTVTEDDINNQMKVELSVENVLCILNRR